MPATRLQLRFRLWGADLVPEHLTEVSGVTPSHSFHVGERRGRAAREVAGWEWHSEWAADDEPLFAEMLRVLAPHANLLHQCVVEGATASLTIVGTVSGSVVDTPEEADARSIDAGEPFAPFFDADRVALFLSEETVAFLAAVHACVNTHVDVCLDDEIVGEPG